MHAPRRVLVTGGSGLVGKYLVDLLAPDFEIEILDLRAPQQKKLPFHRVDLLGEAGLDDAFAGCDAVVHLAGIPHPLKDPANVVFATNTLSTRHVLDACARNGVPRCVFLSSESTLGFAFSSSRLIPQYVPIDEAHPVLAHDPYGMSKLACERMCAETSSAGAVRTICLRAPWIWVPDAGEKRLYAGLIREYEKWWKNLWAFIDIRDLGQAIARALRHPDPPRHAILFVSAAMNWTESDSRSLMERFYPETTRGVVNLRGNESLINCKQAETLLGFHPKFSPRDLLEAV